MNIVLNELLGKYYDDLEKMLDEFSRKCAGGSKASLMLNSGRITIELK